MALGHHALVAGHVRAADGAGDSHGAGAAEAGQPLHAAPAAVGADPDRSRSAHSIPAVAAHRQHARRARAVRRGGQLSLRAGAAVAGQRAAAEHAAGAGVAARLHRRALLVAPVSALSRRAARAAVRRHRRAAGVARRFHGVGAGRGAADREPRDAGARQGADQLAERGEQRGAGGLAADGPIGLCRRAAAGRRADCLALLRVQHQAEAVDPLHRRTDHQVPTGPTLLEISRMHGIPHASVCGGRARCSTCRVRIDEGADSPAPRRPTPRPLRWPASPRRRTCVSPARCGPSTR